MSERDADTGAVQVPGFPNYFVNRQGELFSRRGTPFLVKLKLYGGESSTSRSWCWLCRGGRRHVVRLDEIVAMTFKPRPDDQQKGRWEVKHLNGALNDNRPENLEWVKKESRPRRGRGRPSKDRPLIHLIDVQFCRFLYDNGLEGIKQLTELYPQISYSMMSKIVLRHNYKNIRGYGPFTRTAGI